MKSTKNEISALTHVHCSACGGLVSKKHFSSHRNYCKKNSCIYTKTIPEKVQYLLVQPNHDKKYAILKETILNWTVLCNGRLSDMKPVLRYEGQRIGLSKNTKMLKNCTYEQSLVYPLLSCDFLEVKIKHI